MVQSQTEEEPLPDPAKTVESEYVFPDEDGPDEHNLKMGKNQWEYGVCLRR